MVFIGSCAGSFYALDREGGSPLWVHDIRPDNVSNFHGEIHFSDSLVIIGADGRGAGQVYAFDIENGDLRWQYTSKSGATTEIVQLDSLIYFATDENELVCLNVHNGRERWTRNEELSDKINTRVNSFNNAPLITADTIFFGGLDGKLSALNALNGTVLWEKQFDNTITTDLTLQNDTLYFGTADRQLISIDKRNGMILKQMTLDGYPFRKLLPVGNSFIFHINWAKPGSELVAVDRQFRELLWKQPAPDAERWVSKRPHIIGQTVLTGTNEGTIKAFDVKDGREVWQHHLEDAQVRIFADADDQLFIGSIEGMLYVFQKKHR